MAIVELLGGKSREDIDESVSLLNQKIAANKLLIEELKKASNDYIEAFGDSFSELSELFETEIANLYDRIAEIEAKCTCIVQHPVVEPPVVEPPIVEPPVVPPVVDPPTKQELNYINTDIFKDFEGSNNTRYFVGYSSTDQIKNKEVVTLPDFLPVWGIAAEYDNGKSTKSKFGEFEQFEQKEKSIVEKYEHNGLTYYVRPKHEYDENTLAYDLNTFPDITIPEGKILFNHCNFRDWQNTGLLLRVGGTYASKDNSIPESKKSVFVGDQWLLDLKMPQMYADQVVYNGKTMSRKDAFNLWCKDVDANELLKSFQKTFRGLRGVGHVIWNAEDVTGQWWVDRWKLDDCFKWWQSTNPTAKISAWGEAPYQLSQIMWNGDPKPINWDRLPHNDHEFGLNYGMTEFHKLLGVWEIGDYFNRFDSDNYIHRLLCEYYLNAWARTSIGKPEIKIIPTFFTDMEHNVDSYMAHKMVERTGRNGVKYKSQVKANVLPQLMFNVAAWSMAVMDGIGKWDDTFVYLNDATDEYGNGWSVELGRDYTIMDDGAYFQYRNRKGDNYFYWAIHNLSSHGNKQIIEDKSTQWVFPKMPDVVAIDKSTLLAYKKSGDKTLVLAMAHPAAGNSTREETINIDGKDYNILLHGQWTSIIRLDTNTTNPIPTDPPIEPTNPTEPSHPNELSDQWNEIAMRGYKYGGDYLEGRNERSEGVAIFNWYSRHNAPSPNPCCNTSFPSYTDEYVLVEAPSHSINYSGDGKVSAVHYKMINSKGEVVLEVYDTKSGSGTSGDRANNHYDNTVRWFKKDIYKLVATNISETPKTQVWRAGTTKDANGDSIFSQEVKSGESITRTLDFRNNPVGYEWHSWKINCNVY